MCVCIGGHGKASSRGRLLYVSSSTTAPVLNSLGRGCGTVLVASLASLDRGSGTSYYQRGVHDYEDPQGTSDESSRGFSLNRIFQTRVSCRKNSQNFLYYLLYVLHIQQLSIVQDVYYIVQGFVAKGP